MILDPDALLRLVGERAAKHGVPLPTSHATMQAIVAEAERLAAGRRDDEPAALFYACAQQAHSFGKVAAAFLDDVAAIQAAAVDLELDASQLDLVLLRGRIAFAAVGWEAVRSDFAGWLRRPSEKRKRAPPKRPR
jgi:hypothetical protein